MTQEIITAIVIGAAAVAAFWKLYRRLGVKPKKEDCGKPQFDGGSGCGSCAADCPLKPGAPRSHT